MSSSIRLLRYGVFPDNSFLVLPTASTPNYCVASGVPPRTKPTMNDFFADDQQWVYSVVTHQFDYLLYDVSPKSMTHHGLLAENGGCNWLPVNTLDTAYTVRTLWKLAPTWTILKMRILYILLLDDFTALARGLSGSPPRLRRRRRIKILVFWPAPHLEDF